MPDPSEIAARLRRTETVEQGRGLLDELNLTKNDLVAVGEVLGLSRLDRLTKPKLKERILQQAIGARRKYSILRSGWQ